MKKKKLIKPIIKKKKPASSKGSAKKKTIKVKAIREIKVSKGVLITKDNIGSEDFIIKQMADLFAPCRIVKKEEGDNKVSDFTIEIINPLTNRDKRLVSGKLFSVLLMGAVKNSCVTIDTKMIGEIQNSLVPLMFVIREETGSINYLWLDESFFTWLRGKYTSNWITNEKIELPTNLFSPLKESSVADIERYLMALAPTKGKVLEKGAFFEIRNQLKQEMQNFIEYSNNKRIDLSHLQFSNLLNRTENSIYTIAIVGPSRTGKSTLINALVKQKISPVNVLPTTGVPFTIQYGKKETAEVIYADGKIEPGDASVEFLEKFIDQKYNPKNQKSVKYVTVSINSDKLEKGMALCDVPGLDDVNDEIRRISKIAVYSSNAIIYLIDTAPYKYGGFSFNSHHLEDLRELAPRMDRLYLVFNKVDALDEKELAHLKEYIKRVLEENDLLKLLPNEPIYISAKQSFDDLNKKKKGKYDIELLEGIIWDNLLKTNKNGLYNLGGLTYEFKEELFKLRNILHTKIIDSDRSDGLKAAIDSISLQLARLSSIGDKSKEELLMWLKVYTQESVSERIENLKYELEQIPINAPLPNSFAIKQYLESNAFSILNQVFDEVIFKLDNLYGELNYWVSKELSQIEIVKDDQYDVLRDKSKIYDIIKPISDSYSTKNANKNVDFLSGLLGVIEDAAVGIFGFLERLFVGREKVRQRQIEQILNKARHSYFNVFNSVHNEFGGLIKRQYNLMTRQLRDRAELYLSDVNKQLRNIVPADSSARLGISDCISEIEKFLLRIERIKNELVQYTNNHLEKK